MKIKIFETFGEWTDDYDVYKVILNGYTDWEEVSDKEYNELKQYVLDWNNKYRYDDSLQCKLTLIMESDLAIIKTKSVEYFKEKIKLQKEKQEKARIKAEQAAKNKEKNDLAKKKKQLEKLANELQVKVVKE